MKATLIRSVFVCLAGLGVACAADDSEPARPAGHPVVPSARQGEARPHSWIRDDAGGGTKGAGTTITLPGFSPSEMALAYNIPPNGGLGATVAIVDAYDSPNVLADLNTFSQQFSLPVFPTSTPSSTVGCSPTFTKMNENGAAKPLPQRNSGWEIEINLDTQWVHAIAPCANIVLVEASSASSNDLLTAVLYARTVASVVSMSWGGSEFYGETYYDGIFNQTGVTFLSSSGDSGEIVSWPAVSPYVIGVGGTQLVQNTSGGFTETVWSGSGGGCSVLEPALSFQSGFLPKSCTRRGVPDVAISGGPESAVPVLVSDQGGWYLVYGTSLSVQMWAGLVAIANDSRSPKLTHALSDLYSDTSDLSYIVPITTTKLQGSEWNSSTGLGSPKATNLIGALSTEQ